MPASRARTAAFDILLRVERQNSYASDLLHSSTYESLSTADHSLATELTMGVLRWRSLLDEEISHASSQSLSKLDPEILIALRLALYQLCWLDRIPPRAAINESVELVKRARKRSAAPFVNAVLRKLANGTNPHKEISGAEARTLSAEALARAYAHPAWLVERWAATYGLPAAHRICQHNQSVPTTSIRLRTPEAESELRSNGIELAPGAFLASARKVQSGDITHTQAFRTAQIVIQDEASQLVAALVGYGSRILDCCAAPGNKTLAMADRNPEAAVTAVELHPHRARILQTQLQQSNSGTLAPNLTVLNADANNLPASTPYDRVLADVPCSGTGTLSRNPEIKWRLKPEDLTDLQARQHVILCSAMAQVASGGRLIYSTCSLEIEENEDVVEHALEGNNSLRVLDCGEELAHLKAAGELTCPDILSLTRGPYLRTLPGIHPCEGFFAAILERQ
jgi:16S rRNA (cytosine967-C5)-methyltransferase